ncbi:peptide deformylase [Methylomagnum sp.]
MARPHLSIYPILLAAPLLLHACASPTPAHRAYTSLPPEEWQTLLDREQQHGTAVLSVESPAGRMLLEQPSRPAPLAAPWLGKLIAQMERTARQQHGAGLAAVQVGIPVRVALLARRDGHGAERFQAFVNPEIIGHAAQQIVSWEHCLSVPWGYRHTERPARVTVRYQNLAGEAVVENLEGGEAVVFQQEMDHLNGRLLNSGLPRQSFIPAGEMEAFMAPLLRDCRGKTQAECDALMKAAWEKRASRL